MRDSRQNGRCVRSCRALRPVTPELLQSAGVQAWRTRLRRIWQTVAGLSCARAAASCLWGTAATLCAPHRSQKPPDWNDKSREAIRAKRAARVPREQRLLEDYAAHNGTACLRAAQLLRDVAALSLRHDTCGLLQLPPEGVPGFADVLHVLLHTYALLDHFLLVRF